MDIDSKYREEIEKIKDLPNFEELGDSIFLNHSDFEARLLWAFYRPAGSHNTLVSDEVPEVAIMAFNHSRLAPLERFSIVNPKVINDDICRNKIRNRARMLFRALVDSDFIDLIKVLELYPIYTSLACDQLINGRKYTETKVDLYSATKFLNIIDINENILDALYDKLPNIEEMQLSEIKDFLSTLEDKHKLIQNFYIDRVNIFLTKSNLHPLQKSIITNQLNKLIKLQNI